MIGLLNCPITNCLITTWQGNLWKIGVFKPITIEEIVIFMINYDITNAPSVSTAIDYRCKSVTSVCMKYKPKNREKIDKTSVNNVALKVCVFSTTMPTI